MRVLNTSRQHHNIDFTLKGEAQSTQIAPGPTTLPEGSVVDFKPYEHFLKELNADGTIVNKKVSASTGAQVKKGAGSVTAE